MRRKYNQHRIVSVLTPSVHRREYFLAWLNHQLSISSKNSPLICSCEMWIRHPQPQPYHSYRCQRVFDLDMVGNLRLLWSGICGRMDSKQRLKQWTQLTKRHRVVVLIMSGNFGFRRNRVRYPCLVLWLQKRTIVYFLNIYFSPDSQYPDDLALYVSPMWFFTTPWFPNRDYVFHPFRTTTSIADIACELISRSKRILSIMWNTARKVLESSERYCGQKIIWSYHSRLPLTWVSRPWPR